VSWSSKVSAKLDNQLGVGADQKIIENTTNTISDMFINISDKVCS